MAQFDRFAAGAEAGTMRDRVAGQPLRARLDRVARADKRLLDAYEAGAISLGELSERRRHLADERLLLERQKREADALRHHRMQAQAVRSSLEAFCDRTRGRLEAASFADKQAILQLVIDRIIVGDGSLEIRHVIPLRAPQPGGDGPDRPDAQLRSDGMNPASLVRGAEHLGGGPQAFVIVSDDEPDTAQTPVGKRAQEGLPEGLGLRGAGGDAQDLASPVGVDADNHYHGGRYDPAGLPDLQIRGVDPQIRPGALDGPGRRSPVRRSPRKAARLGSWTRPIRPLP
jgi:hypothetical protein